MNTSSSSPGASIPALILAAGRGARMRPLTDACPKPLLEVHGQPLMQWPMQSLFDRGFKRLVINTAWLGDQVEERFRGWGASHPGASLAFSHEGRDFGRALETAGGISRALPLLDDLFWVLAGDVFAPGFAFDPAFVNRFAASDHLAHIWLVPNPPHHPGGDFGLSEQGMALNQSDVRYTFSTIGLYKRALFEAPWSEVAPGNPDGVVTPLAPLLRSAMAARRVSASLFKGDWTDVGTPERLAELNQPHSQEPRHP